jgi:hypothetical protein
MEDGLTAEPIRQSCVWSSELCFTRFCWLLRSLPPFLYSLGHLVYMPFQFFASILELLHYLLLQIFLLRTLVF